MLVAPCTRNGTYYDNAGDTTDARGTPGTRGLLMFQDHGNSSPAKFSGGTGLAFAGAIYLHATSYAETLTITGGASTGTYILGEIVVDRVTLSGNGAIKLALNPSATMASAKVSIFN